MRAQQCVEYEVNLCHGVFDPGNDTLARAGAPVPSGRRCVVTDSTVNRLYGDRMRAYFEAQGIDVRWLVLDPGEENKGIDSVRRLVDAFDEFGLLRRQEPVIAVGGGVVTDIVGFACSLYRRGLPHIKVPTTLIGLVDAAVGAKTGVNHGGHKNRIGTYFPPRCTLLDTTFLATLPDRQISNGMAEILKIALVLDSRLFELLETHGLLLCDERFQGLTSAGAEAADEVLRRAIGGMLAELEPNLWEERLDRLVDYGHTFSPVLEMGALPALLHGEAVAIDMALTTVVSWQRGLLSPVDRDRVLMVMTALALPLGHPAWRADLAERALADAVRHRDGRQRVPLATGIGSALFFDDLTAAEVRAAESFLQTQRTVHA
ncbi:sedoheptulose 7-phosphate cyclase [Streptomyces avidinii]